MQEFLTFLILHEVPEVLFAVEFYEMNFVGFFYFTFNVCFIIRPDAHQHSSVVFRDERDRYAFELIEDAFLSLFDVDQLSDVEHGCWVARLLGCWVAGLLGKFHKFSDEVLV